MCNILFCLKGHLVKFFTVDQNVEESLECIFTKFELFTLRCFQDIAVQSEQFSSYFRVTILPVYRDKKLPFGKLS